MNLIRIILLAMCPATAFIACQKEEPKPEEPIELQENEGVLVLNEGLFRQGNASLSFIDWNPYNLVDSALVHNKIFEATNERMLGDIGHSMEKIGKDIYVVINNSGVIRVLSDGTDGKEFLEEKRLIQNLGSPRFVEDIDTTRILVTELYDNKMKLVNKLTGEIEKKIHLKGMTEELVRVDNQVFITNNASPYLYLFNTNELEISDSLFIGGFSNSIKRIGDKLVLLRNADSYKGNTAAVMEIDPLSFMISDSSIVASKTSWWYARSAAYDQAFYFVSDGTIMKYESTETSVVQDISSQITTPYGIFVDENGIWVSDALDYQSEGKVILFPHDDEKKTIEFTAGIIPNAFLKL